jgi:thiol-disulfide isomerase/thioredoxin
MDVVTIGRMALPVPVLLPGAALLASMLVAEWLERRHKVPAGAVLWKTIVAGLLAARAAFVLAHLDVYRAAPLEAFDIRDGGLVASAGLLAGLVVGAELTRKAAPLRKPVLAAALAGAAVWIGGALATHDFHPAPVPVPLVELRRLDGSPVQLRTLAKGKPMVLNLWASWCPPCRREMPVLRDAQARNRDIEFVFVNQGEDAATIQRYLADQGLALANVLPDRLGEVGKRTGSVAFPTTLFFNKQGILASRQVGGLSAASLDDRLATLRPVR